MGFQIRPVSMNSGAVAHRGAAVAPGSESGGHSAGTQRFKRPRYAAAAAFRRRSRRQRRADRDSSRTGWPAQASKCLRRCCLPHAWFREKPLSFGGARRGTFDGDPTQILIAGRDNFRDNRADNRFRVTCDVVYT